LLVLPGATGLPFSCNSVWSTPPPASWAIQFCILPSVPGDQLHDPPPVPHLEVGFSPYPCCQHLCLSQTLLGASETFGRSACSHIHTLRLFVSPNLWLLLAAPLGGWLVTPPLLSAFCCLTCDPLLRVQH
jgi:hypothetical protein